MYVLVRNDLAETYRIVQGSHALAQYALDNSAHFKLWNNRTIVFLGVRNLIELKEYEAKLKNETKVFSSFREPDLDNQLTGLACFDNGYFFKDLKVA